MTSPLLRAWDRTVRACARRRAIVDAATGRACTFGELDARSRRWREAHAPGEALAGGAVIFAAPNGIAWFEIFLGLLRAGAVVVPLDAAEPAAARRDLAASLGAAFWWDGERLVPGGRPKVFRTPGVCLIKLTSGTTGRPRPLPLVAAQLLADARQVTETMRIGPADLNYALIPLGHSYGLGNLTMPLLARGIPLVCGSAPLPHAIAADFRRWRPTVFPGVPALWQALAASDAPPAALRSLRLGISAGAPLAPETARAFAARFRRRLHNFYGSSETGGISFDRTGAATLRGGVGRALRGVTVVSLSRQRIRVCSAAVFTPAGAQRRGGAGSWIPADRARVDAQGELVLLGRRGATVKIAGRRINPAEVAVRLRRLDGVREAWVAPGPGPHPLLGAVVAGDRPVAEWRDRLREEMAAWKIPKKWIVLPRLPVTPAGKVDSRALRALLFPPPRA